MNNPNELNQEDIKQKIIDPDKRHNLTDKSRVTLKLSGFLLLIFTFNYSGAQSVKILYSNDQSAQGWYTESTYSPIASYNGSIYFVMLDKSLKPFIGKVTDGVVVLEPLDKKHPEYRAYDDGHHEFSLGIDKDGFIHVTGDMHNFPGNTLNNIPADYIGSTIMYWKSSYPEDISDFDFIGLNDSERIPGRDWTYGTFRTDRNGVLYYMSRINARTTYSQHAGRALGIFRYNITSKTWTALGALPPVPDATASAVIWENSGRDGGSYNRYKGDMCFDTKNRMHITCSLCSKNGPTINTILYAFSDDGGNTFYKAGGEKISLPMETPVGDRQADVIESDITKTYDVPRVTHAWNDWPVIEYYDEHNKGHYRYWNGESWSSSLDSEAGFRGTVLYNEHSGELMFVNIVSGKIFIKQTFTGTSKVIDTGKNIRYFDYTGLWNQNILTAAGWTGDGLYQIKQLTPEYTNAAIAFRQYIFNDAEGIVSPNPVSSFLNIKLENGAKQLKRIYIYNLSGALQFSKICSGNLTHNVSDWDNGVYLLKVEGLTFSHSEKFVINRE